MPHYPQSLPQLAIAAACIAFASGCHPKPPEAIPAAEPAAEAVAARIDPNQPDTVSEQDVLTEGRRVFHTVGLCYACHGGRLQGGPVAPPLVGPSRDLSDTSFAFILSVVRGGAPHTPMVARQGGIDAGQILQVANYVWAVSNGKSVP
jgi:mono/diheme cytochrome c family protein